MNPYLKASLEELVELVNGNNSEPIINTHEEYLQAVAEHDRHTADLHMHIEEFNKHCDNVDIAKVASTIVQEIKSKGISVEDDMSEILAIISKNTGIKVSTEEAITVLIIITVAIFITAIIAKIINNYLQKRKFNAFIDKELHQMEKAFEEINKELGSSVDKNFDDFLKKHSKTQNNNAKIKNNFVIKKVPKYLEHNDKSLLLELGALNTFSTKIKICMSTLDISLRTVSGGIAHLSQMITINNLIVSDSDTSEEKIKEKIKDLENSSAKYVVSSNNAKDEIIKFLHDLTSSKETDLVELNKFLVLIPKENVIETDHIFSFSSEVSKNIESCIALNKKMSDLNAKIIDYSSKNKAIVEKIKTEFEKHNKDGKDKINKAVHEISSVGSKQIKIVEQEYFNLLKVVNTMEKILHMHYSFLQEIERCFKEQIVII